MKKLLILILILLSGNNIFASEISIRVLILKHSNEKMADDDAKLVIEAINKATNDNLDIKEIGNHFIHQTKKIRVAICKYEEISNLKEFVSDKLKINKVDNDTVIIFTVGHGFTNGKLDNLGQRSEMQLALASAAEENNQRVLWWQLSCYASAKLPSIDSLPTSQRELFSVLNTSDEKNSSLAYIEGKLMEKLFFAMASASGEIDVDQNYEITGNELKEYLNKIKKNRGNLLRTLNFNNPIFGINIANKILIIDRTKPIKSKPGFILMPSKH